MTALYHGGAPGLRVGDVILPGHAPPVEDDCPICLARAAGTACTVGEWREWVGRLRIPFDQKLELYASVAGTPDSALMDPPARGDVVYVTPVLLYARWYAACRSHADLYVVEPVGVAELDEIWTAADAAAVKRDEEVVS